MGPKVVLVIDDDKTVQDVLRGILQKAGYRVSTAVDAMQGVMMARQVAPDVIILDLAMPAGGGAVVLQRLRQMTGTAHVPILVYSASPDQEAAAAWAGSEGAAFLGKPASPEALLEAVARILAG